MYNQCRELSKVYNMQTSPRRMVSTLRWQTLHMACGRGLQKKEKDIKKKKKKSKTIIRKECLLACLLACMPLDAMDAGYRLDGSRLLRTGRGIISRMNIRMRRDHDSRG